MAKESAYKLSTKYSEAELRSKAASRMRSTKKITKSEILSLDDASLRKKYSNIARQVNRRLLQFKKVDISSSSTRYITTVFGQYFGEGVTTARAASKLSTDELRDLAIEMARFLNKPTSVVEGELLSQKKREKSFVDNIKGFAELNIDQRDAIFTMMHDETIEGILQSTGKKGNATSKKIVEALDDIMSGNGNITMDELNELLEQYHNGELFLNEVWSHLGITKIKTQFKSTR